MTIEYLIQLRITTELLELGPDEVLDRLRQLDYIKEAQLFDPPPYNTRCDSCQELKEVQEYHSIGGGMYHFPLHLLLCSNCWYKLRSLREDCRHLDVRLHPCGCGG